MFQKVSELLLRVRFPHEVHDVREFIQPNQFHVRQAIEDVKSQYGSVSPWACWDWVCREVQYPFDVNGRTNEYHRMDSYAVRRTFVVGLGMVTQPMKHEQVWWEWFDFPWEILAVDPKIADCDGSSILLCNMLRAIGQEAQVAIGGFATDREALSHAWVITDGQVWETTTDEAGLALPVDNDTYQPLICFDESNISLDPAVYKELVAMEYVPALDEVYRDLGITRNCAKKMQVICQIRNGALSCNFV